MSSISNQLQESNSNFEPKLKQLLDKAIVELETKIKHYDRDTTRNEKIIHEFGLKDYCQMVPDHLAEAYSAGPGAVVNNVNQILKKSSNELTEAQLRTHLNSMKILKKLFEDYLLNIEKEIKKYETEYFKECQNCCQDGIDFTTLQTNIHKLTADIHQANEQQEQKNVITGKLRECFEIKKEIEKCQDELNNLKLDLENMRHLPPNLSEAEKKLNDIKKKYKEISNELTKRVTTQS